ncbi:MAG: hypothetical protein IOMNBAOH_02171 [Rhodocyclaceae bacterium]|nr:hypothetical protein [Rhodocyclaceae bacterium]
MAISVPGLGSNLDVDGIVSKLMQIERQPLTALDSKEASYQTTLSAIGSLKGTLSSLQTAMQGLSSPGRFVAYKTSLSDSSVASVTTSGSASPGQYSLNVTQLAQAHKLYSAPHATSGDAVGTGQITIQFGTYDAVGGTFTSNPDKASKTLSISAAQNSLAGVRDAINAAQAGVSASIVQDGSGYRLTLTANDSGSQNSLRMLVTDDDGNHTDATGLSKLAFDPIGAKQLTQSQAAQNAALTIDGLAVSKPGNTITDALDGVTLNLLKTGASTLSITRDTAAIRSAVDGFVKAYNEAAKALKSLGGYNADTKVSGPLNGNSTLRLAQAQLRELVGQSLDSAGGGLRTLADVGIRLQRDGSLKLDTTQLDKVLADPTKDIATLFAAMGKPSDSLIAFKAATTATKAGDYAVNITQLARQASLTGSTPLAATTLIDASNDTLDVIVDGVAASVTLTHGSYTRGQLTATLQSRLAGAPEFANAGIKTSVGLGTGADIDRITLTSQRYGGASSVELTGGNAAMTLFGVASAPADVGVEVAGSIGGVAATGSGQTLTASGGDAEGLALTIGGGATGDRGSVRYAPGIAVQMDRLITSLLDESGSLAARTDGMNASIKRLNAQRDAIARRLVSIEANYRAQFSRLDALMSSMNQTSSYLQQQIAQLNASSK